MIIEFSSKLLLEDYPKLISSDTFAQCLYNIEELNIATLDINGLIADSHFNKLHITRDLDLKLTDDILNRLNLCTGNYRKYKWQKYNTGIRFANDVKSPDCKKEMTIYNKEVEIALPKNKAFLTMTNNTNLILDYFEGKTRFEVKLENPRKIKRELEIEDTAINTVFGVKKDIVLTQFDIDLIQNIGDYGIWNIIRYHKGDLKKIEQEIKDIGIYGAGSRAALGRQMKNIKTMAIAYHNEQAQSDDIIEQIRNKLSA